MPAGSPNPEISEALTVAPEVVYSPMVPEPFPGAHSAYRIFPGFLGIIKGKDVRHRVRVKAD